MDERNLSWLLAAAQARVRATSALLALPRECHVDECVTLLREAQGYLEWLLDRMRSDQPAPAELRAQAAELAGEIRRTGALLGAAVRMGRRWLERLTIGGEGYTPAGGPARLPMAGHVSVLG